MKINMFSLLQIFLQNTSQKPSLFLIVGEVLWWIRKVSVGEPSCTAEWLPKRSYLYLLIWIHYYSKSRDSFRISQFGFNRDPVEQPLTITHESFLKNSWSKSFCNHPLPLTQSLRGLMFVTVAIYGRRWKHLWISITIEYWKTFKLDDEI